MTIAQPDLLAPLEPEPAELARVPGSFEGPEGWQDALEAVVAGVRVWCGPRHGWRSLGELRTVTGVLLWHEGRLSVGLSFDLGAAALGRREVAEDEPEQSQS